MSTDTVTARPVAVTRPGAPALTFTCWAHAVEFIIARCRDRAQAFEHLAATGTQAAARKHVAAAFALGALVYREAIADLTDAPQASWSFPGIPWELHRREPDEPARRGGDPIGCAADAPA